MRSKPTAKLIIFLLFLIFSSIPLYSEVLLSHPEGLYREDIFLSITDFSNSDEVYFSFDNGDEAPGIPYDGGFLLSAIEGEERTYKLNLLFNGELISRIYTIDRKAPLKPEPVLIDDEDGYGWSFVTYTEDVSVFYGYDDYRSNEVFEWTGERLLPPKSGFIYYYSQDQAGNRSETDVLRAGESESSSYRTSLDVKSPVEGEFSNPQLLFIDKQGFEWIKYSLNGTDPAEFGADYLEPVEIRRYGSVTLKIAAKPENSGRIVTKEINYRVNTKLPLKNLPASGIYSSEINISNISGDYRYCLEERSPGSNDRNFDRDIKISPVYGGVKYSVLRINGSDEQTSGDFRYFYIIDDRNPASPIINFESGLPAEPVLNISIKGPAYSDIYYTLDGSTPGRVSNQYRSPITLDIPEEKNAGSIIIKARAVSQNGKNSPVISRIFTYDTKNPDKPEVEIIKNPESGLFELRYEIQPDQALYYTLTDASDTEQEDRMFSPVEKDNFFIDCPYGTEKEFNFIFAAVDNAGNWSEYSEVINLFIDKRFPEKPVVDFSENKITVLSEDRISYDYKITRNGETLFTEKGVYSGPLSVDGDFNDAVLYIDLVAVNDAGIPLHTSHRFYFPAGEKVKETVLFSKKSEDTYSGAEVAFFAYPDGINDELYYYLTELMPDGERKTTGPFETDGYILIKGTENRSIDYFLEVFSVDRSSGEQSMVNSYEFTIDNEKPVMPVITGIGNNSVVNDRVIVEASGDNRSTVFLNHANEETEIGRLFTDRSIVFNKAVTFDVKPGEEKDFFLKIGAGDSAGNSIENPEIFKFTIDKRPPELTEPRLITDSDNSLRVSFTEEPSTRYYYEVGRKGAYVKTPDKDSKSFSGELRISPENFEYSDLILKIKAGDKAGNFSRHQYSLMYSFDNAPPEAAAPEIHLDRISRKISFIWPEHDDKIMYRTVYDDTSSEWMEYMHPFSLKYESGRNEVVFQYYFEDLNGNRSDSAYKKILLPSTANTELSTGIVNNSQYNRDLDLIKNPTDKIIRYEISTDKIIPPEVNVFSPVLPELLPFKVVDGESLDFTVSLKEFENLKDQRGGAVQLLRFSIDKQPPEPPVIGGIKDGEYYLNDRTAFFEAGSDKIFYSVRNSLSPDKNFTEYKGVFDISSPDGIYNSYIIEAYTQDFSGNTSTVESWEITIDKEIIYVSTEGRDYYEGTRSKPFRTINKALEHVKFSDRKTIFVSEGRYDLKSPGVVDESVTVYGGFIEGNWQEKSGKTEIYIDNSYPEDNPAFYIYGGKLKVENIIFTVTEGLNNSVFFVNKGTLNISNSRVFMDCNDTSNFILQHYGELTLYNSQFSGEICSNALISSDYGRAEINNCSFDFISQADESSLIKIGNSIEYNISSTDFMVNKAASHTVIEGRNSSIILKRDNFRLERASVTATVIETVDSRLEMMYSKIKTADSARISRAVVAEDSRLNFRGNTFDIDAGAGMIGFSVTGGDSFFINNRFALSECGDFSYMFMFNGGKHEIETNILSIGAADEVINLRSRAADVDFFNNNVILPAGRSNVTAFKPADGSVNRIINNIINRTESAEGSAAFIYLSDDSNNISIKNNCLHGWNYLAAGIDEAVDIVSLDLIDSIYSGGRISDNISEAPERTFTDDEFLQLSPESACIDSGYNLKNIISESKDIDGEFRPNSMMNSTPAWDIGVDEYYQK